MTGVQFELIETAPAVIIIWGIVSLRKYIRGRELKKLFMHNEIQWHKIKFIYV